MHRDVARAQVSTLNSWADEWEREGQAKPREGHGEVAFLLRRAGAMMSKVALLPYDAALLPQDAVEEAKPEPPPPEIMGDVREG